MLGNYTPKDNSQLDDRDLDLGSTSPVLVGGDVLAQGGKDGLIRLVSIKAIAGTAPHAGGELQSVSTPSGGRLFTAPAVWRQVAPTRGCFPLTAEALPLGPSERKACRQVEEQQRRHKSCSRRPSAVCL